MARKKTTLLENTTPALEKAAEERFCSFCRKSANKSYRMIAGPDMPKQRRLKR
jgi:hypothetical protein